MKNVILLIPLAASREILFSRLMYEANSPKMPGPICSKLTMPLVNISLKLWSLNMEHMLIFFAEKMWVVFAFAKATHVFFFFSKNTCELDIVLTRTATILTNNELVKLTMLWTTGPRQFTNISTIPKYGVTFNGLGTSTQRHMLRSQKILKYGPRKYRRNQSQ